MMDINELGWAAGITIIAVTAILAGSSCQKQYTRTQIECLKAAKSDIQVIYCQGKI